MPNILFTFLIFPIQQVIELCYVFAYYISRNTGLAIIGMSFAVSTLILPLYLMAEKKQQAEREKRNQMKPMVEKIKAVFKGDEQYMMLSTLYCQNNYHPVYALRSALGLFIQVPFFIAAFSFLSNLKQLNGQSFFFLTDLGSPDGLLNGINLLPILMTATNIISGAIYTKGLEVKDKIQVYGIAVIFLLLLYNSPAALVLYWTFNNIYNLIKNLLQRMKNPIRFLYICASIFLLCLTVYVLFFRDQGKIMKPFISLVTVLFILLPVWKRLGLLIQRKINVQSVAPEKPFRTFILSLSGIVLLTGLVIPSSLIASSVSEFSYLDPFSSPLPFLGITLLQTTGILLWIVCIFLLFDKNIKNILAILLPLILGIFMLNVFFFSGNYGHMTPDLKFSGFGGNPKHLMMINIISMIILCLPILVLLIWKKGFILNSLLGIIVAALLFFGISNIIKINKEFHNTQIVNSSLGFENDKIYTLSSAGKNILLIMLDGAYSGYLPFIFEEKPELLESFKGFTYYPNTISLGPNTRQALSAIYGGYYYSPYEMYLRKDEHHRVKYNEAMMVLPLIMANSGFDVSVYDQQRFDNLQEEVFFNVENIRTADTVGRYTESFLAINENLKGIEYVKLLYSNFIRFSFFKCSPLFLHKTLYDGGSYFSLQNYNKYLKATINNFASLYFLSEVTEIIDNNENYAIMFANDLPHVGAFLQAPDYMPSGAVTNKGEGPLANFELYHTFSASILLLSKWFNFLDDNNVYNNTRIIIVSDHGQHQHGEFIIKLPENLAFALPNGETIDHYNALLMVKDFDSTFDLKTDYSFMTNADVPHLTTENLVDDLINPFTGNKLILDKSNGVLIPNELSTFELIEMVNRTGQVRYDSWMRGHTNILDPANWSIVENP
jgi:YidC/Oxa1 family membrane protein insertase